MYKYKRDERKTVSKCVAFFFLSCFSSRRVAFIFFSKELDCSHNNNNRTTPILEQSLFVVITYILREKAVVIINHV